MKQTLAKVARWAGALLVAGVVSYVWVLWALGFRWWQEPFAAVGSLRGQVREIVAFEQGGECNHCRVEFARSLGVTEAELADKVQYRDRLTTLEQVIALNPHPPVLRAPFGYRPHWLSVGFLSHDDRYHQVTWYAGEADTTPSILVPKVRGRATAYGDYFVRYTVVISRETRPQPLTTSISTGAVISWREPNPWPDLDSVDWEAYAGGSYDGFEEFEYTLLGTVLLGPVLALAAGRLLRRRSPVQSLGKA